MQWIKQIDINFVIGLISAIYLYFHNHSWRVSQSSGSKPPINPIPSGTSGLIAVVLIAFLAFACSSRVKNDTLKAGQCILDKGVLSDVIKDLAKSDYVQLIQDAIAKDGPEIVGCALDASSASSDPTVAARAKERSSAIRHR